MQFTNIQNKRKDVTINPTYVKNLINENCEEFYERSPTT